MLGPSWWSVLLGFCAVCTVAAGAHISGKSDDVDVYKGDAVPKDIVQTLEEVVDLNDGVLKKSGDKKHSILKCPLFEVYLSCGPTCQLTCDTLGKSCPAGPCVPGCFCKDGKVRSENGKCVHKHHCCK